MKMRKILGILRDSYCRTTGIEYMHIQRSSKWIQDRVERPHESSARSTCGFSDKLNEAEIFETFLTKFVGQKRFSLEGGESAIVLWTRCEQAAEASLRKSASACRTAAGSTCCPTSSASRTSRSSRVRRQSGPRTVQGSGDVKYHLGSEGKFTALSGATIKTSVAANPSHLEAVNPVLEGIARAKQDILDRGGSFRCYRC